MDRDEGHLQFQTPAGTAAHGSITAIERSLLSKLLEACGYPSIRIALWTGQEIASGNQPPIARLVIHDRGALLRMLVNPELFTGDDYSAGRIDVEGDLVGFLDSVYLGLDALPDKSVKARFLRWLNRPRANTLAGSKANIHHHYDLGNDFYKLWLDTARMQYTCAYYPRLDMTIEEAQIAKLDHVARKLQIKPGDVVYEAGCGWGGLARHLAQHYGVAKVRAFNISQEQVKFARERAPRRMSTTSNY